MSQSQSDPNTDRLGLEILSPDECWSLIASTTVGRVAFVDAGEPMILPVTHSVDGHSVVFRSGPGTKLGVAERAQALAFEVDGWDAESRTGWSVLVRGTGDTVYDADEIARIETDAAEPWLEAAQVGTWVRVRPHEVTGRRLG